MQTERVAGSASPDYVFDNAAVQAGARFSALAEIFDPGTIRHLNERGVGRGWHCLEVGGGSGSVARWLSEQVGSIGSVLVTDIDTRFLETMTLPNVEVRRHNIVTDSLPESAFDLVHSRLVLLHLPEREKALRRMIAALKPGGWLVDEDFDSASLLADPVANPVEVLPKTQLAMMRLVEDRGVERRWGRLLLGRLRAHGLVATGAEARMFMWQSESSGTSLMRANFQQLRADMIKAGYITEDEFKQDLAHLEESDFLTLSPIMWTAWGRRPQALT
jgi:SAM-dependent methyltransferase